MQSNGDVRNRQIQGIDREDVIEQISFIHDIFGIAASVSDREVRLILCFYSFNKIVKKKPYSSLNRALFYLYLVVLMVPKSLAF